MQNRANSPQGWHKRPIRNLYSMSKPQDAIRPIFRVVRDRTGNLPPLPGIFPDYLVRR
jgi:hypothetical protein